MISILFYEIWRRKKKLLNQKQKKLKKIKIGSSACIIIIKMKIYWFKKKATVEVMNYDENICKQILYILSGQKDWWMKSAETNEKL